MKSLNLHVGVVCTCHVEWQMCKKRKILLVIRLGCPVRHMTYNVVVYDYYYLLNWHLEMKVCYGTCFTKCFNSRPTTCFTAWMSLMRQSCRSAQSTKRSLGVIKSVKSFRRSSPVLSRKYVLINYTTENERSDDAAVTRSEMVGAIWMHNLWTWAAAS
jgi:hypothetical protein